MISIKDSRDPKSLLKYRGLPWKTDFGFGEKFCEYCGKAIRARRYADWKPKRFCNRACYGAIINERGLRNVIQNQRARYTCELCGDDTVSMIGPQKSKYCYSCVPRAGSKRAKVTRWQTMAPKYHISKPQFEDMFKRQNGKCVLCSRGASDIDHDHETGRIRGILCRNCNLKLNFAETDPGWFDRAKRYLGLNRKIGPKWT